MFFPIRKYEDGPIFFFHSLTILSNSLEAFNAYVSVYLKIKKGYLYFSRNKLVIYLGALNVYVLLFPIKVK